MAQNSTVWINPHQVGTTLDKIFTSLSQWFAGTPSIPFFPNGISLGNGVPATFSASTGAQTAPALAAAAAGALSGDTLLQTAHATGTTTAGGVLTVTFPKPFPNTATAVIPISDVGTGVYWWSGVVNLTATTFQALAIKATGTVFASGAAGMYYVAFGH